MTFFDNRGTAITNFNSIHEHFAVESQSYRGTVFCEVAKVPFLPGSYRVAVAIQDGGANLDHIPNALLFNVDSSVFFRSHRVPDRRYCTCMVEHRWDHSPQDAAHTAINE
jgi:hypothetical protein